MSRGGLRSGAWTFAVVLSVWTTLWTQSSAQDAGHRHAPIPFCRIGLDITGSTLADVAFHSPVPILIAAGATYKVADLAHDIGDAAVDRENHWLDAELVLVGDDAKRLKEIKASGGDLNGPDADALKQRLRDHAYTMTSAQNSPVGYTLDVIIKNFPYAVAKVGIDKTIEKTIGFALDKFGVSKLIERILPVPKKVNWLMNYGGPLEDLEKGAGWGRLGTRARGAQKAAEEAMQEQEEKIVADYLSSDRTESLKRSAADVLAKIYGEVMAEHPSQSRTIVAPSFRLEVARQAVLLPAPMPAIAAVPAAAAVAVPAPAPAILAAPPADPVVRVIRVDDASGWERYSRPAPSEEEVTDAAPTSEPADEPDPADEARRAELHEELMRVGDGKTFAVCSNGCPSTSDASWDGSRGQTLSSQ